MPIICKEERRDDIRCLRLSGTTSLEEVMDFVANAIAQSREAGRQRMLVNGCALEDVPIPSLVDRFLMVEEWAGEARGIVAVVMVVPPEYILPDKFGIAVATKLGMQAEVWPTEEEAFAWLDAVARPPG